MLFESGLLKELFEHLLTLIHSLVGTDENICIALIKTWIENSHSACYDNASVLDIVFNIIVKMFLDLLSVNEVVSLKDGNKFIAADTVNGAVLIVIADNAASLLKIFVTCIVTV